MRQVRSSQAQIDPHFLTIQIYLTKQVDADTINNLAIHSKSRIISEYSLRGLTHLCSSSFWYRSRLFNEPSCENSIRSTPVWSRLQLDEETDWTRILSSWNGELVEDYGWRWVSSVFFCVVKLRTSSSWNELTFARFSVYYCGPSPLAKVIKSATKAAGSKSVKFSFAKEHFVSSILIFHCLPVNSDLSFHSKVILALTTTLGPSKLYHASGDSLVEHWVREIDLQHEKRVTEFLFFSFRGCLSRGFSSHFRLSRSSCSSTPALERLSRQNDWLGSR